jgi:hypothetical protein
MKTPPLSQALSAGRRRRTRDRLAPNVPSSEELPGGLDWQAFAARFFPGRRRHDLEALTAYGTYRRSPRAADPESFDPSNQPVGSSKKGGPVEEANRGAAVETGVQAWEEEGGSAP